MQNAGHIVSLHFSSHFFLGGACSVSRIISFFGGGGDVGSGDYSYIRSEISVEDKTRRKISHLFERYRGKKNQVFAI